MLQIGEIEQLAAALFLRVLRVKPAQHVHQPARGRGGRPQIAQHLSRGRVEPALRVADGCQTALAALLHAILQLCVLWLSHRRELAEVCNGVCRDVVPRGKGQLRRHGLEILREHRRIFFRQHAVTLHRVQRDLKRPLRALQNAAVFCDQVRAPNRLLRAHSIPGGCRLAARHPRLRIHAAARRIVHTQQDLAQPPVVAAIAELVDERAEGRIVHALLVARVQHGVQRLLAQRERLLLLRHAEIGGQIEQMAVIAQHGGAERVHRGDLRHGKARRLALQVAVFRVARQPLRQLLRDLAAQLRGGGLGVGDDEKFVHIRGPVGVADQPQHAVDQHLRLAGARCGRHEKRTAAVFDHRLLGLCQDDLSHAPHLLRPASRIFPRSRCGSAAAPAYRGRGGRRHKNRRTGSWIPAGRG